MNHWPERALRGYYYKKNFLLESIIFYSSIDKTIFYLKKFSFPYSVGWYDSFQETRVLQPRWKMKIFGNRWFENRVISRKFSMSFVCDETSKRPNAIIVEENRNSISFRMSKMTWNVKLKIVEMCYIEISYKYYW